MLDFIGCGSAFNTALGNNCAFYKNGKTLLLIDCGNTAFSSLQRNGLLEDVQHIFVLVTHLHPDHIGSLGDLIFYSHFVNHSEITVFSPDIEHVAELLKLMGMSGSFCRLVRLEEEYKLRNQDIDIMVKAYPAQHVNDMACFGYLIKLGKNKVYYSGDAKTISGDILEMLYNDKIDAVYQDTCTVENAFIPHMSYEKLCDTVKPAFRNRVFCMHLDEDFDSEKAKKDGFRVVELKLKC